MIFLAMVVIIADSFFRFPVARNHGVAGRLKGSGSLGDQGELLIPIRMMTPRFEPFAVRWHGIVMSSESSRDRLRTHRHPLSGKGFGEMVEAFVCPQSRRLWVSLRAFLHETQQCRFNIRIDLRDRLAATPNPPDAIFRYGLHTSRLVVT